MTKLEAATYLQCMAVCAMAEIAAMQASNSARDLKGVVDAAEEPTNFQYADFMAVIDKYGIHHNSVLTYLGNADG